ncbi:MAG TPA: putative LPS assembly protein LptD, partial [Ferruginibacter sp.]|nr:putative LPS assembly protein LptD [Ferruginibacter sp.]
WDNVAKVDVVDVKKGFYAAREMAFGMGVSTRIFGLYGFSKRSKIQGIRHEIRPSVGVSYHPNMNGKSYYSSQIDDFGNMARFSYYERNIFGAFGEGKAASLNFNIDNNIQMKVRNRKDTTSGLKKMTLIDGLSLSGGYNFLADSFKLSTLAISARTNLFEKFNITANGTLDPYLYNSVGDRIDKLVWTKRPLSLGKLMYGNVALQSQFKGGNKAEKQPVNNVTQTNPINGMPLNEYQQEAAYISNNPAEYANFNIPWSVNFSYALTFQRQRNTTGYQSVFSQNLTLGGTLNLTPKWQMGMNGYYNITTKEIGSLSMYLTREMHCWQMAINVSPIGKYRYFNISISPKSGILRDLKINRTRYFYDL